MVKPERRAEILVEQLTARLLEFAAASKYPPSLGTALVAAHTREMISSLPPRIDEHASAARLLHGGGGRGSHRERERSTALGDETESKLVRLQTPSSLATHTCGGTQTRADTIGPARALCGRRDAAGSAFALSKAAERRPRGAELKTQLRGDRAAPRHALLRACVRFSGASSRAPSVTCTFAAVRAPGLSLLEHCAIMVRQGCGNAVVYSARF